MSVRKKTELKTDFIKSYRKEKAMGAVSIIKKNKMEIGEKKDLENALAEDSKRTAILEYIAACDHPEIFAEEEDYE